MEWGEAMAAAAARETEEETGLRVEPGPLIGFYGDPALDRSSDGSYPVGTALFLCTSAGGEPRVTEETTAAGWFSEDALPPLWGPHARRVKAGFDFLK